MKRKLSLLLALLFLLPCLTACGSRPADAIIEELIYAYGRSGDLAEPKVEELLAELRRTDRPQGELWADIMDYWHYTNTELTPNVGKLPGDLPEGDNLCIVVLGYALRSDGSMQEELIGRLEVALSCARQYPHAFVLCTGGGTAANNSLATEADAMAAWLLDQGLEQERLIVENRSLSTVENAELANALLLADYPQVDTVVLVSSSYHIAWASLLFEAAFLLAASEDQRPEIHVVSNCAYPIANAAYRESDSLRWQTSGLLQLVRDRSRGKA